jgi:peptidoglycan hydrolase-like protein with peptidoglycan-binding domain
MTLQSVPLANSLRLREIDHGGRIMMRGERGLAVGVVQGALFELGYMLPFSVLPNGSLDGIYGKETEHWVHRFQEKTGLKSDGRVGIKTIREIDSALLAHAAPKTAPAPPRPPPPPPTPYKLGTANPPLSADAGSGIWNSKEWTAKMVGLKYGFLESSDIVAATIGVDAAKNLIHYFDNDGKDWSIDLDKMIREVPSARAALNNEVDLAKTFAETLGPGTYDITSVGARGGYNRQHENQNWFLAVGGYTRWGKGHLVVTDAPDGRRYDLLFDYRFYDRYNWDGGKSTHIMKWDFSDDFLGEFNREGLAKEYDYYGAARRRLQWKQGEAIPDSQIATPLPAPTPQAGN